MRFNWAWTPVLAIACAAIANAVMIAATLRTPPDDAAGLRPGSTTSDAGVAARRRFAATGAAIAIQPLADGVRIVCHGAALSDATVALERPSDARLDRTARWSDPATPLIVALPRGGRWDVRVSARDAHGEAIEHVEEAMIP